MIIALSVCCFLLAFLSIFFLALLGKENEHNKVLTDAIASVLFASNKLIDARNEHILASLRQLGAKQKILSDAMLSLGRTMEAIDISLNFLVTSRAMPEDQQK